MSSSICQHLPSRNLLYAQGAILIAALRDISEIVLILFFIFHALFSKKKNKSCRLFFFFIKIEDTSYLFLQPLLFLLFFLLLEGFFLPFPRTVSCLIICIHNVIHKSYWTIFVVAWCMAQRGFEHFYQRVIMAIVLSLF